MYEIIIMLTCSWKNIRSFILLCFLNYWFVRVLPLFSLHVNSCRNSSIAWLHPDSIRQWSFWNLRNLKKCCNQVSETTCDKKTNNFFLFLAQTSPHFLWSKLLRWIMIITVFEIPSLEINYLIFITIAWSKFIYT
jgi:hypothetical protein